MRAPVGRLCVRASEETVAVLARARLDLVEAGNVAELVLEAVTTADPPAGPEVTIELADEPRGQ